MTKRLIVEPAAAEELERGVLWYEHERPGKGAELADEAERLMNELATAGVKGAVVPGVRRDLPVRRRLLPNFPYAIIYVETDDALYVLAVAHLKRRPNYWLPRLRRGL